MLTNEKYVGHVLVGKTYSGDFPNNEQRHNRGEQEQFLMNNAHEPAQLLKKRCTTVYRQKCSAGATLKLSTAKQNEKMRIIV
ncbi:MAG TPA: hypothetical protein PLR80_00310 [Saccharofermentans sp.]|nr:hypothetical protein [Saccharofermentans sp.]